MILQIAHAAPHSGKLLHRGSRYTVASRHNRYSSTVPARQTPNPATFARKHRILCWGTLKSHFRNHAQGKWSYRTPTWKHRSLSHRSTRTLQLGNSDYPSDQDSFELREKDYINNRTSVWVLSAYVDGPIYSGINRQLLVSIILLKYICHCSCRLFHQLDPSSSAIESEYSHNRHECWRDALRQGRMPQQFFDREETCERICIRPCTPIHH